MATEKSKMKTSGSNLRSSVAVAFLSLLCFIVLNVYSYLPTWPSKVPTAEELQARFASIGGQDRPQTEPLIKIHDIGYLIVQRSDSSFEETLNFFLDFGLIKLEESKPRERGLFDVVYLRGYGTDHHVVELRRGSTDKVIGIGVTVNSSKDLSKLIDAPGYVSGVTEATASSGGGKMVTMTDPQGIIIEVRDRNTWERIEPVQMTDLLPGNTATTQNRPVNHLVRPKYKPSEIYQLSHCVFLQHQIMPALDFYINTLGMIVSDFQFLAPETESIPIIAFLRTDRGPTTGSPHHTVALGSVLHTGLDHCAFLVDGFDDIGVGSRWLEMRQKVSKKRYAHAWGIGRHILGSNIFDYWKEPAGDIFEHTADVDTLDASQPTGYHVFTPTAQHSFGPDMTITFIKPISVVLGIIEAARNKFENRDLTFSRILAFAQSLHPGNSFVELNETKGL